MIFTIFGLSLLSSSLTLALGDAFAAGSALAGGSELARMFCFLLSWGLPRSPSVFCLLLVTSEWSRRFYYAWLVASFLAVNCIWGLGLSVRLLYYS